MRSIVVIDDEPVIREMIARHLTALGWRVLEADNGDSGLALVFKHRPAAVLCDLLMPGTNGFTVCRSIRARRDELGAVVVIVTTGSSYVADRQCAIDAGADHYLVKPISPKQVTEILGHLHPVREQPVHSTEAAPAPTTSIRFWGVRGSVPVPGCSTVRYGGNTSCVEVRIGNELFVLDAGTGLRRLGLELEREFAGRPYSINLLLSHTHWDHIQGLPFFAPARNPNCSITIHGHRGPQLSLAETLSEQMSSPFFPVSMERFTANIEIRELREMMFRVGKLPVQTAFAHHPGVTVGYRLGTPAGGVVYLPDNEIMPIGRKCPVESDASTDQFNNYKNQLLVEFAKGAEVFIADAQYTIDEYALRFGWGHSCIDDTVRIAIQAKVKRLVLFHHDPARDDDSMDRLLSYAQDLAASDGGGLVVEAAQEGQEIQLAARVRQKTTPATVAG